MSETPPRLVILDTDPGVDDALALLYLRAHPALRLLAITTVFGNADIETTTRNALYLRDRLGLDVPIHQGAGAPLRRPRGASPAHVHGDNGLGDLDLSGFSPPPPDPGAAHEKIIALIRAHPHAVTLVAIGPLTNLALALRAAPDIAELAAGVAIMGGAFGAFGRNGNVTPFAEANIHNDPEAAAEVLAAAWPVTLTPLDATTPCVLSNAVARDLAERGGRDGRLAYEVSRGYAAAYARYNGLDGCVLHDVAVLACLLKPEAFTVRSMPVSVTLSGKRLGQTTWSRSGRPLRVCIAAHGDRVAEDFRRAILNI